MINKKENQRIKGYITIARCPLLLRIDSCYDDYADELFMIAPASEYIVMPERDEVIMPKAILYHYVSDSKPWYFRHGWQHVLKDRSFTLVDK